MKSFPIYSLCVVVALLSAGRAWGATRIVDGACLFNGNGADGAITCASSNGASGPWNSIESAVDAGVVAAGDHIQIRGSHPSHGTNHAAGTFDGRYSSNDWITISKAGSAGNPIVLENYGYSGTFGSGETVIIEGTTMPVAGWTKCDAGCTGTCSGVTAPCLEVWYTTGSGTYSQVLAAQKPDGSVTYRESSLAAVNSQFESYSNQTNLWVRWGSGGDTSAAQAPLGSGNLKPYVLFNNNGHTLDFGFGGDASHWTVQGLTLRNTAHQGVVLRERTPVQSGITIRNNTIRYAGAALGAGDDYGISSYLCKDVTIDGNDISDTGSEAIHVQAPPSGTPAKVTITSNWIHRICDPSVMGPNTCGTPHCMTLGDSGGGFGGGDYSGDHISGNLCTDVFNRAGGSYAKGIQLENHHDGSLVHDNIFERLDGPAIQFSGASGTGVDGVSVYNNLCHDVGRSPGSAPLACIEVNDKTTNAKIYNNTSVGQQFLGTYGDPVSASTGNQIRNNLAYAPTLLKLINWGTAIGGSGNEFDNNLLFAQGSGAGTIIATIGAVNYIPSSWVTSADVDASVGADSNRYGPSNSSTSLFSNLAAGDYRLGPISDALSNGTLTGMPARTGINNSIAKLHGLPDYSALRTTSISASPEIGAWEAALVDGGFESGGLTSWPTNTWRGCGINQAAVNTTHPIFGSYALKLGHQGSIFGGAPYCEAVHQSLTDLDTSRIYTLTGTYWSPAALFEDSTNLTMGDASIKLCQITVGYNQNINFSCSFTAASGSLDLTLETAGQTQNDFIYIDNLELK